MRRNDWHLRISVTDLCNFRCLYCNPDGLRTKKQNMSADDIKSIMAAAGKNGIKRVHWTGGEPTIFRDGGEDIVSLVSHASELGYTDQSMTTNGSTFYQIASELAAAGLNRVNISLDTLNRERNLMLTKRDMLDKTKKSIEAALEFLPGITKINVVAMRETLTELPLMVAYASALRGASSSKDMLGIKLIEICPNNPAQLQKEGEEFYVANHVGRKELMFAAEKIGPLKLLNDHSVEGDNPNCRYYQLGDVAIGFVTMPSTGWPCGGDYCYKFRITPYGGAAICIQEPIVPLIGKGQAYLEETIQRMMDERESLDARVPKRIHFRAQLGEMRFGNLDGKLEPKSAEYFEEACERNK